MDDGRRDFDLLHAFALRGDQPAFASVVQRHINLVYATALRKLADEGSAEEVTQDVFAALAQSAWRFGPDDSLAAWLYRTTLLKAKQWVRGELRRRRREQTAAELGTTMKTPDDQTAFRALLPLLEEALLSLREKDRTALLLRFYESRSLRELGAAFGVGEDAAQKRVAAALDNLAGFFQRRGFRTATVAAAAAALQHTAASAPSFMAAPISLAAAASASPATGLMAMAARLLALSRPQKALLCVGLLAVPAVWHWQVTSRIGRDAPPPVVFQQEVSQPDVNSAPEFIPFPLEEPAPAARTPSVVRLAETTAPVTVERPAAAPAGKLAGPRLTGLVDLPGFKAAFLEVPATVTNRAAGSPAAEIFYTNHLFLVEVENSTESPWLAQPTMEILQIDSRTGTVRVRDDGKESVYALVPGSGGASNIRLRNVRLKEVLMLYGIFRSRTVLCHPAAAELEFSLEISERDRKHAAEGLRSAFERIGIATSQLGERFEAVFPARQSAPIMEAARRVKLAPSEPTDAVIPAGAIQLRDLPVRQAQVIYGELIGRKPAQDLPPVGLPIFLVNQTPLTRNEAIYAFDILLGWQDLKVVFESQGSFRLVLRRHR